MTTSFSDNWKPSWEVEKDFPDHKFTISANGKYRSGRDRFTWKATEGPKLVETRDAMRLRSRAGNVYYVVRTEPTPQRAIMVDQVYF